MPSGQEVHATQAILLTDAIPLPDAIPLASRPSLRWCGVKISISGRASKPARVAHAPEPMAVDVLAETEPAASGTVVAAQ
jgi:hypothetical protein